MRTLAFATLFVIAVALVAICPASAVKVYVNPSIQTANVSPDGAYNEGYSMQIVQDKLLAKLNARGFGARGSGWLSLAGACDDAVAWNADCFVALHTNAAGPGGWYSATGTDGFYYQTSGGSYDPRDLELSERCVHKCVEKFSAWGRGYDRGSHGDWSYFGYHLYVLANTPNMNSVLIEGLFHTNYDDVYQVLINDSGKDAYAQAIFEAVCDFWGWAYNPVPLEMTIDNIDGDFAAGRKWATSTAGTDKYGADYRTHSLASSEDAATWTPNIPVAGNWEVYAWWPAASSRYNNAGYIINHTGGTTTVRVNQQINGGMWNSLGVYNFAAGTGGTIKLSCVGTGKNITVAADAIRLVQR